MGSAQRIPFTGIALTGGVLLLGGAGFGLWALDRAARDLVDRVTPTLERNLAGPLGHPVQFGSYAGLRPWGIALGPSRILPTADDRSEVSLASIVVQVDPLASLRNWQPVIRLRLQGARAALRRSKEGQYWLAGKRSMTGDLPRITLLYELEKPAEISVAPVNQSLRLFSRGSVVLGDRWFSGRAKLQSLDGGGSVNLEVRGRWDQPEIAVRMRPEQVDLGTLALFTSVPAETQVGGRLNGDLRLSLKSGQADCLGGLQLKGLQVEAPSLPAPFRSDLLKLSCRDRTVQLTDSRFQLKDWSALASGSVTVNHSIDLAVQLRHAKRKDNIDLRIDGPWTTPRWRFKAGFELPADAPIQGPVQLVGQVSTPWSRSGPPRVSVDDLNVAAQDLRLRLAGDLFPALSLQSRELVVSPGMWQSIPALNRTLGAKAPIEGRLAADGTLTNPSVRFDLSQSVNPLLERWRLKAQWSNAAGLAVLNRLDSPQLSASGQMPLAMDNGRVETGELNAGFELRSLALDQLSPLVGVPMGGMLSARGRLQGPLKALRPEIALDLNQPRFGPLMLPERWQGRLRGVLGQGAELRLASDSPSFVDGKLTVDLASNWWPTRLGLERGGGGLTVKGADRSYSWRADQLALDGLQVAFPPQGLFEGVSGDLSGEGQLALNPFSIRGDAQVDGPVAMGIDLKALRLSGTLADGRFQLEGDLQPPDGEIVFQGRGNIGADLSSRAEAKGLDVAWLVDLARRLREQNSASDPEPGRAEDLGALLIDTFGGSLDGQLKALALSREALEAYELENPKQGFDPEDLRGRLDAVLGVKGPRLSALELDLEARGHLWLDEADQDVHLQMEPFVATLRGPFREGEGVFTLLNLPFSLLALFAPIPPSLTGAVGINGRYRLDGGLPGIEADLVLDNAKLGEDALVLDRKEVIFGPDGLKLDLALRSSGSQEPITVRGSIPLRSDEDINVLIESHNDALTFLTQLAGESLKVKRGSTDLRLILRGSLEEPQANGFLVVQNADVVFGGQGLQNLEASLLFDFNRLEVQKLNAKLASGGSLKGAGAIGLFDARTEQQPLSLKLSDGSIRHSIVEVKAEADLTVTGSLLDPVFAGEVNLNRGVIRPRGSLLTRVRGAVGSSRPQRNSEPFVAATSKAVTLNSLIEEQWDFKEPLVLFGPGADPSSTSQLQALLPNLSRVRFQNLRLALGPDLTVRMPPILNFRGGGNLLLNGPLDPSLQVRGVVRLNRGRISLFSTTFRLDHKAPNVAVFTPSLGLVPYVDIAMKSQVSDSVQAGTTGVTSSNVFETNGQGTMGPGGGQLRLVKVTVQATGPANRLMGNLELRSSPPLSQAQLLSLIGGNSLAGLAGGGAGAALATVVGQTLLSPVLGTLSDVMGERLQIALYPTYVTPSVNSERERTSGRVPPTFTVVTEVGVDVSDRFDFSVLAAPNNSDVPPQATVTYQVNPNTTLSGSVDSEGTWQSQLRLFFRF